MQLEPDQKDAIERLKNGSILVGGTGAGKSITGIAYYFIKVCGGELEPEYLTMTEPRPLYIITTAKKRNSGEWDKDLAYFLLSSHDDANLYSHDAPVVVDSWNNIQKYVNVSNAFFIFDEQRVVGSGAWVKAFYKIAKKNQWILMTATPGDKWEDYIPVFIANGFYRNRTEFKEKHIEMDPWKKYTVKAYHNTGRLLKYRQMVTVKMNYEKETISKRFNIKCKYDRVAFKEVIKTRWDPFKNEPIKNAAQFCYILRKIVNSDPSRVAELYTIVEKHPRLIIFYNFDYELYILREFCETYALNTYEYNGHKHDDINDIPDSIDEWVYLVQYDAASEAWNCITTCAICFYSLNYSYKKMKQSEGRIDRRNTPYKYLYYYRLTSDSAIDLSIGSALNKKKKFNENDFGGKYL